MNSILEDYKQLVIFHIKENSAGYDEEDISNMNHTDFFNLINKYVLMYDDFESKDISFNKKEEKR